MSISNLITPNSKTYLNIKVNNIDATGSVDIIGNANIEGNLTVHGDIVIDNDLTVNNLTVQELLIVENQGIQATAGIFSGALQVQTLDVFNQAHIVGNSSVQGNLNITGLTTTLNELVTNQLTVQGLGILTTEETITGTLDVDTVNVTTIVNTPTLQFNTIGSTPLTHYSFESLGAINIVAEGIAGSSASLAQPLAYVVKIGRLVCVHVNNFGISVPGGQYNKISFRFFPSNTAPIQPCAPAMSGCFSINGQGVNGNLVVATANVFDTINGVQLDMVINAADVAFDTGLGLLGGLANLSLASGFYSTVGVTPGLISQGFDITWMADN